jgi:hypothetical protein
MHSGSYAGNYSGYKPESDNCREYWTEKWTDPLSNWYFSGWFYVPAYNLVDPNYAYNPWLSIATFQSSLHFGNMMGLDVKNDRYIYFRTNYGDSGDYTQKIKTMPVSQWFHIEIYAYDTGTTSMHVLVYQDGTKIIDKTGNFMPATMNALHFGLYADTVNAMWLLNDDMIIQTLSAATATAATTNSATASTKSTSTSSTGSAIAAWPLYSFAILVYPSAGKLGDITLKRAATEGTWCELRCHF